jgi:predicted deacylase
MQTELIPLVAGTPGVTHHLKVHRFGHPGGLKATIQAALHADEVPALLVAQQLREQLAALDDAGQITGEIVLVPFANPLGLAQELLGRHQGRFDLRDGINFNRQIPDLTETVAQAIEGRLSGDAEADTRTVRQALREAAAALTAQHPVDDLKRRLLQLATDADIVLDLHCDSQAVLHLYALTPQADLCAELGALMGAQAMLLATESGGSPFDEACSRPWWVLQQRHPQLALGCFATTVELRGECDTSPALARQDATAIVEFLRRRGLIAGVPAPLPPLLRPATPLAASEPITAPHAGVLAFRHEPGDFVEAGAVVAELVCPDSGTVTPLRAQSSGVLYARIATRWAWPGTRVAKIAGTTLARTGLLLSA